MTDYSFGICFPADPRGRQCRSTEVTLRSKHEEDSKGFFGTPGSKGIGGDRTLVLKDTADVTAKLISHIINLSIGKARSQRLERSFSDADIQRRRLIYHLNIGQFPSTLQPS